MTTIFIVLIALVFVIVIGVMALGICYYARDNCDELLAEREQRELQRLSEQPKPQPNVEAGLVARPKKSPTKPIEHTMPTKPIKPTPTHIKKRKRPYDAQRALQEYEEQHPRDAHGRFTKQSSKPTKK